jgi:hypothetical protein
MSKAFISYRRADTACEAGRIYDRFVERYGANNVFKDLDSISFGEDFRTRISRALRECSVVLVIIGEEWLKVTGGTGMRRLDDPEDLVRIEIETALQGGARVVPLLVQGASIPRKEELPTSLQQLQWQNATVVRGDPDFHRDVSRLISVLEPALATSAEPDSFQRMVAIRMVGHSAFLFWWPVWLIGFCVGCLRFYWHVERPGLDLLYFSTAGLLLVVTTISLPSGLSMGLVLGTAILSYVCYSTDLATGMNLSQNLHVSGEVYLICSVVLFTLWVGVFRFIDPRATYVIVQHDRIRVKDFFNSETSFAPSVIVFRIRKRDVWRNRILAFGSGDLVIQAGESGRGLREYRIHNLLFVGRKAYSLERIFPNTVHLND